MTVDAEQIDPGFSTADAEHIELSLAGGELVLRFTDWRETKRAVRFTDVTAYSWQPEEAVQGTDQRNDVAYRLNQSKWLSLVNGEDLKHLRFWFNAAGVLDVVCRSFEVER